MIFCFLNYLNNTEIKFCITNGYEDIINKVDTESDIDILFKKNDFDRIESIIKDFCKSTNFKLVQILHHDLFAKNIFLYDSVENKFLNLDIYGELSRNKVIFFEEHTIFNTLEIYKDIPIISAEKEFISYLIKKIDKKNLSESNFIHLRKLYTNNSKLIKKEINTFFKKQYLKIISIFENNDFIAMNENLTLFRNDFYSIKTTSKYKFLNIKRILKRIFLPTGITVSFLGPDGSGKSTIIDELLKNRLPYRRKDYFHLKPIIVNKKNTDLEMITDPHKFEPYSPIKSYLKLFYFIYQYNKGWFTNISKLKIKSSLIIFDRYFDDLIIDNKRYRYGGNKNIAKIARLFIPKPDIYFILTADAEVIYERKQEVPFEELQRQVLEYRSLGDNKQYLNIDVNRTPDEIVKEITKIIMEKMNERY